MADFFEGAGWAMRVGRAPLERERATWRRVLAGLIASFAPEIRRAVSRSFGCDAVCWRFAPASVPGAAVGCVIHSVETSCGYAGSCALCERVCVLDRSLSLARHGRLARSRRCRFRSVLALADVGAVRAARWLDRMARSLRYESSTDGDRRWLLHYLLERHRCPGARIRGCMHPSTRRHFLSTAVTVRFAAGRADARTNGLGGLLASGSACCFAHRRPWP